MGSSPQISNLLKSCHIKNNIICLAHWEALEGIMVSDEVTHSWS